MYIYNIHMCTHARMRAHTHACTHKNMKTVRPTKEKRNPQLARILDCIMPMLSSTQHIIMPRKTQ